eukprot:Nitzschia sp. Nitz4//scaffold48_size128905//66811//70204//NITZ4_003600-RA/size128905-augustus-gene-0.7-mRNA-1//1//CDS//3329552982//1094//frame0
MSLKAASRISSSRLLPSTRNIRSCFLSTSTDGSRGKRLRKQDFEYCVDLVQNRDRESYLCGLLMPHEARRPYFAVRAFNVELASIKDGSLHRNEDASQGPSMAIRIRAKWWKDAIDQIYGGPDEGDPLGDGILSGLSTSYWNNPVVRTLDHAVHEKNLTRRFLERLVEAREEDLDVEQLDTKEESMVYAESICSSLLYLSLETAGVRDDAADLAAYHAGIGIGLTTALRGARFRLSRGECSIPKDLFHSEFSYAKFLGEDPKSVLMEADKVVLREAVEQMAMLASYHLTEARDRQGDIPKHAKPCFLPVIPALHYLSKLEKAQYDIFDDKLLEQDQLKLLALLGRTWLLMSIPLEVVRWLVLHSTSNKEVATLSNVSHEWAQVVADAILEIAEVNAPDSDVHLLLFPSMIKALMAGNFSQVAKESNETYCLAWFEPNGILTTPVSLYPEDASEDEFDSYFGFDDNLPSRNKTRPSKTKNEENTPCECIYQWNGYREAHEVLSPFGYTRSFVKRVLDIANERLNKSEAGISSALSPTQLLKTPLHEPYSTFAVRGSTLARPEGYCLCWDNDGTAQESLLASSDRSFRSKLRQQEYSLEQRRRRKLELKREVLPRVLESAPAPENGGISSRSVQFLNVDASHAVRLFTPPFQPGPVPTPITVVCVGVATEDGCFMSGLRSRFELGHLYPETELDSWVELSPVCLRTKTTNDMEKLLHDNSRSNGRARVESIYSDDSSYDTGMAAGQDGTKCGCSFSGVGDLEDESDDEEFRGALTKGKRGPGSWHCYVAVFDGIDSQIRIDGCQEPVRCHIPAGEDDVAYLDGLTIGADHPFDMSLCFGQGSDGDGMGAIAELAVFKGRLDLSDIEVLEDRLMRRYSIPRLEDGVDVLKEYEFYRIAHTLLSYPPETLVSQIGTSEPTPLRYLARHRSVAWKYTNPVSGIPLLVDRIGTRDRGVSSDW